MTKRWSSKRLRILQIALGAAAALCLCGNIGISRITGLQQQPNPPATNCGPPHYCASTDQKIVPYPATPLELPSAGSSAVDPAFGSRVLRVTDASLAPRGGPMHTPASSEQNAWNSSTTAFYVGDDGGGYWVYSFDPGALRAEPSGARLTSWRGEPEFSYSQPNVLYGVDGRSSKLQEYDIATHKFTAIDDPSKCARLEPDDHGSDVSVSADDNRFMAVFGPEQDRNTLVYIYDRKQGCRWYNTETGEVGGQWGLAGTITAPYRFGMHNARLSKSGDFVVITSGGGLGGSAIWEVATSKVTVCANAAMRCGGHRALGYAHLLNSADSRHPLDFVYRPLDDLEAMKHIVTPLPPQPSASDWFDYHLSWNYIDNQDTTPACFSTYRSDNPVGPGVAPTVKGPWENEIDCVETDGLASTIWRFAHTYSTARNGFWSSPRGNVSDDGRFYMFTSDWEDELGQDRNQHYRTDVFVVQLR